MRTSILIVFLSLTLGLTFGIGAWWTASVVDDLKLSRAEAASYLYDLSQYSHSLKSANSQILVLKSEMDRLRSELERASSTIIDLKKEISYKDELISYLGERMELRMFTKGKAFEDRMRHYSAGMTILQNNACVPIALTLVRLAREDGYLVSTEIIEDAHHMVVSTVLENGEIWYYDYNTRRA